MRYFNTVFKHLTAFIIAVSIIPLVLISIFLYNHMENLVEDELYNSRKEIISQNIQSVEEKLNLFRNSLRYISNNTIIHETMQDPLGNPYNKGLKISEEVTKSLIIEGQNEIKNCMIYSIVYDVPVYGRNVTMMSQASCESWYKNTLTQNNGWTIYTSSDGSQIILSIINTIQYIDLLNYTTNQLGIIKLDLLIEKLFSLTPVDDNKYLVAIYDNENNYIYSSDVTYKEYLDEIDIEKLNSENTGKLDEYTYFTEKISNYEFKMVFLFRNSDLIERKKDIIISVVLPILLLIIIIAVTSFFYTQNFSSRVGMLLDKFKYVELGDLEIKEPIQGIDEIADLDKEFSHMLQRLNHLIQVNYIQKLEKKETQLQNLQLQIAPHFLYNTLETISSIASIKECFLICDICNKLGEIFRYSLGKDYGEFVTVEQELHHADNYIFIQKVRFGNRFEVFYNIDECHKKRKILRFILQPIVENAIIHGIGNKKGVRTLEISIRETRDSLVISVSDDGIGMDSKQIEDLRSFIDSPDDQSKKNRSLGIKNVHQRIKYSCGDKYGVKILSKINQGSCFELWFPII